MDSSDANIKIGDDLLIKEIPQNFFMIGTMNTADRSLAVVDFALRRRFAWYRLYPKIIKSENFYLDDFIEFEQIFQWFADDLELNLQPGQGYFIANTKDEMKLRIEYELFPLIKEYITEGIMTKAKDEFNNYFLGRINKPLFA